MEYELYHYGIKGMKWGVRRYQKSNGSYTKKGLERYKQAESKYDIAKANADKTRAAYKSGTATKQQYKDARRTLKTSKKDLDKSYDHLKLDARADKGKELYKSGKTVTGKRNVALLSVAAISIGSKIASEYLDATYTSSLPSMAVDIGATVANAIIAGKTVKDVRNLRAYYAH